MRCDVIQCGNLEEDVTRAKILLLNGKNISSSHGLSVFSIQFSHALGMYFTSIIYGTYTTWHPSMYFSRFRYVLQIYFLTVNLKV